MPTSNSLSWPLSLSPFPGLNLNEWLGLYIDICTMECSVMFYLPLAEVHPKTYWTWTFSLHLLKTESRSLVSPARPGVLYLLTRLLAITLLLPTPGYKVILFMVICWASCVTGYTVESGRNPAWEKDGGGEAGTRDRAKVSMCLQSASHPRSTLPGKDHHQEHLGILWHLM